MDLCRWALCKPQDLQCVKMILLMSHTCRVYASVSCARLGMVVIKKGSPTSDYVCGKPPTPNSTATSLDTTAQRFSPSTHKPYSLKSVNKSVFTVLWFSSQNPVTFSSFETTTPSSVSAEVARTPEGNGTYSHVVSFRLFCEVF